MKWDEPKRDKSDFFDDFTKPELETQPMGSEDRPKEKAPLPPKKIGPLWEVDDSLPTDFVKDFFKPI